MRFISLDIETTGLDPDKDVVLEVAAGCATACPWSAFKSPNYPAGMEFQAAANWVYAPLENPFRMLVMPEGDVTARLDVLAMHSGLWVELAKYEPEMKQKEVIKVSESFYVVRKPKAYPIFRTWFKSVNGEKHANVAGKNYASFDARFLRRLDPQFDGLFRPRVLDPAILWFQFGDEKAPSTETCLARLREAFGVSPTQLKTHRAMDDATAVAWMIKGGLLRIEAPPRPRPTSSGILVA